MGFRSFCFTIRPKDGITNECVDSIVKWLKRHPQYAIAVLEMEGICRHLHAQIFYDEPKNKGDITKQLKRIVFDNSKLNCELEIEQQKRILAQGVKIAYNDWFEHYLLCNDDKAEPPNIVYDKLPDNTNDFYPTEEEQESVKTISTAVDKRFAELELSCKAYLQDQPYSQINIAKFLSWAMFIDRSLKVVIQQRDRVALCISLHAYINKQNNVDLFLPKDHSYFKMKNHLEKCHEFLKNNPIIESDDEEEF